MKKTRFFAFLLCIALCLGLLGNAMASSAGFTDAELYLIIFDQEMQELLKDFPNQGSSPTYTIAAEEYFGEEGGSVYFDFDTYKVVVYSLASKTTYSFFDDDTYLLFTACCFIKLDSSGAVAAKDGVRVFCTLDGVTQERSAKQIADFAETCRELFN